MQRLREHEAGLKRIISYYKASAKKRALSWELSEFDAAILLASSCWYCGVGPMRAWNRHGATVSTDYPDLFHANGIDRIENDLGYTVANTRTACWACNAAKGSKSEFEFFGWVKAIYTNLTNKGCL